MRVLIIDDEVNLAEALAEVLRRNAYDTECVHDGKAGLHLATSGVFDCILLDVMLPKLNGFELLKKLRKSDKDTPVILLTARGSVSDRVTGLDCGADDYLPKPFNTDELLARIRSAVRRRDNGGESERISYGDATLYPETQKMTANRREVSLSERENKMVMCLFRNETVVIPFENLAEQVWDNETEINMVTEDAVRKYVDFIKKKLEFIGSRINILEIKGLGYKLLP